MTKFSEQITALRDYFNLDLKQSDVSKIEKILSTIQPKKEQEKPVELKPAEIIFKKHTEVVDFISRSFKPQSFSFELEMKEICELYGVQYKHAVSGVRMNDTVTAAKAHFCRYALLKDPSVKIVDMAAFLNLDHSTIIHLVHYSTVPCKMPQLIKKKVSVSAIFLPASAKVNARIKNTVADHS